MTTLTTLDQISNEIRRMAEKVQSGFSTQYKKFYFVPDGEEENDDIVTIRVGDHGANNARISENTYSFVIETGHENYSRQFKSFPNQVRLDTDLEGENGEGIEYYTEWFFD